jgi:hypothetical protein
MWVISLPIQVGIARAQDWHLAATVGVFLWLVGFLFESLGDFQLARFKSDPTNRGHVEYDLAEASNTPWGESHCYVLWDGNFTEANDALCFFHPKEFHVSPFMDMEMKYRWRLNEPGSSLTVQLANLQGSEQLFDTCMTLHRRELNIQQLRRMTLRYPLMTAQISAAIYYQALKLWWKKCPLYTHPQKQNKSTSLAPTSSNRVRKNTIMPEDCSVEPYCGVWRNLNPVS